MADTSDKILDAAEALISARGFHGFSFQDVADVVGIRKPSLYHHFASKAALGAAVMDRYAARMEAGAAEAGALRDVDPWAALDAMLAPMAAYGRTVEKVCLMGVLGAEYPALPEDMQQRLGAFYAGHEAQLTSLLEAGRAAGAFRFAGPAPALARLLFAALEGGLLVKRALGDPAHMADVLDTAMRLLGRSEG